MSGEHVERRFAAGRRMQFTPRMEKAVCISRGEDELANAFSNTFAQLNELLTMAREELHVGVNNTESNIIHRIC